jgi:serine/threonine-protein kinase HipA
VKTGHWAHCFNLNYSQGPGGEHPVDVCGEGLNIQHSHLMQLAKTGGLDEHWAGQKKLDSMLAVVDRWADWIGPFDIRRSTSKAMKQAVHLQRSRMV